MKSGTSWVRAGSLTHGMEGPMVTLYHVQDSTTSNSHKRFFAPLMFGDSVLHQVESPCPADHRAQSSTKMVCVGAIQADLGMIVII